MFEKLGNAFSKAAKSFSEKDLNEKDIEDVLSELEISLLESDVATEVIDSIKSDLGEKLILNIGAGIAIEKDKDSAINFLELRLKEMQVALQETSNQKQQISASLEQGKQQMEQMLAASRSKK